MAPLSEALVESATMASPPPASEKANRSSGAPPPWRRDSGTLAATNAIPLPVESHKPAKASPPWRKTASGAGSIEANATTVVDGTIKEKRPWRRTSPQNVKVEPAAEDERQQDLDDADAVSDDSTAEPLSRSDTDKEDASDQEFSDAGVTRLGGCCTLTVQDLLRWRVTAPAPSGVRYATEPTCESPSSGSWQSEASQPQRSKRSGPRSRQRQEPEPLLQIEQSDSSWAARQRQHRTSTPKGEQKTDEQIVRAMKSILNKLTIEKYDSLYRQMLDCGISTVDHVRFLIHEVMEKATTQHQFIEMYTQFCVHLNEWFFENKVSEDPKNGFKKILLNECQSAFERHLAPLNLDGLEGEELREAKAKYKLRMLGNLKFVGSLLTRRMLASSVLAGIAEELVSEPCTGEALESLASFLTAVGATFDRPDWQHYGRLSAVFEKVQQLTSDPDVSPRIRFLLRDVLDLRASGWENNKKATCKTEGPMRLEEVHKMAAVERQGA